MELDQQFSDLIASIYGGAFEDIPWQRFLAMLRELMNAVNTTLVLRPPSERGRGVLLTDGGSSEGIALYNERMYTQDPFVDLPPGQIRSLHDFISEQNLVESELYNVCMKPAGLHYSLGADLVVSGEMQARLRISRAKQTGDFDEGNKAVLSMILPHLERAILTHAKMNKLESERALYAGAMEQLAVGSIILDENGRILSCNEMASQLLAQRDGLIQIKDSLHLHNRELTHNLQALIAQVLETQRTGAPAVVEALRVLRPSGLSDLGMVIRPIPSNQWSEGQSVPSVVVFVSDPETGSQVPTQVITRLFGFTPTEANLVMLLVNGLTLDEVAQQLNITRNTARTHLRSMFHKTGVGRQTLLVSLILKSVAPLAGT
jgi:DNA-binding CsgD family transcriptional regulator/PAS domain-containing protein